MPYVVPDNIVKIVKRGIVDKAMRQSSLIDAVRAAQPADARPITIEDVYKAIDDLRDRATRGLESDLTP